jgi:S1-C subfamily serine protease
MHRLILAGLVALALPALVLAAPPGAGRRPDTPAPPPVPEYLQRVMPAVVGIRVEVPGDRPSAQTLGRERWGSGVIFDPAGHILTVSYVLLDAERIEVVFRDGRRVPARLVGLDLEVGLGVIKLAWPGQWPVAAFGDSSRVAAGEVTGTIGVDEEGDVLTTRGHVEAVRPFVASWEYMLDRTFIISPANPAFGGGALVDARGAVIGITSLRLGERPYTNLAIPVEKFLPARDELLARGRVESRPPRPWLGVYTQGLEGGAGVVVVGLSPAGPAAPAGFRRGDVIVRLNGEKVGSQEDFYSRLWARKVGEELAVVVRRDARFETITVRSADRYRIFRTR